MTAAWRTFCEAHAMALLVDARIVAGDQDHALSFVSLFSYYLPRLGDKRQWLEPFRRRCQAS